MATRGTYRQIADDLRQRVVSGELAPGAMVPSEYVLVHLHGVSRGTVRSALAVLEDEGLIESVPGRGRRVVGGVQTPTTPAAYERVAAELRQRMADGEFVAGQQLPSESVLMEQFAVSRNTVRRAYRLLQENGIVEVKHGVGAFPLSRP